MKQPCGYQGNDVPGRGTSKYKGPEASILALLEEQHGGQCGRSRGRRRRKEMQQRGNGDPNHVGGANPSKLKK